MSYYAQEVRRLSLDEVKELAPSVITVDPHSSLSKRYSPISTLNVIEILMSEGWYPVDAEEVNSRKENTKGYQKHLIRFHHPDFMLGEENIESVLTNSHDGLSFFKLFLGIYRFICSNGLMVGDTFEKLSLKHIGLDEAQVIEASKKLIQFAPKVAENMNIMKQIELSEVEKTQFGDSARIIMYPEIEFKEDIPVSPRALLSPRRRADFGKNDLWTSYNVIQENVLQGGISTYSQDTKKHGKTRKVKSIDRKIALNCALWDFAEGVKEYKMNH